MCVSDKNKKTTDLTTNKNATKKKTNNSVNEPSDAEDESSDSESDSEDSDYEMQQVEHAETNATKKSENGFEVVSQHRKFCLRSSQNTFFKGLCPRGPIKISHVVQPS